MPEVLSKKEVETLTAKKAKVRQTAPVLFADEIAKLKKGEGLFIYFNEWTLKTTITNYYASKGYIARKSKKTGEVSGESTLEIKRVKTDEKDGWILKNI